MYIYFCYYNINYNYIYYIYIYIYIPPDDPNGDVFFPHFSSPSQVPWPFADGRQPVFRL